MNEAELIFTEVLKCKRSELYLNRKRHLNIPDSRFLASILRRRAQGEPLQYILGKTEFMGLEFEVNPDVLIPRPETEILVESVIKILNQPEYRSRRLDVLDVGTGSGCIAISLAKLYPGINITATDISEPALRVSRRNAFLNGVVDKIRFMQSDLFASRKLVSGGYDVIVANPPYIAGDEIDGLQPEISFEPDIALNGGEDGLDFYRKIIKSAYSYLKAGGILALEAGFGQKSAIKNIFQKSGKFEIIDIIKDYNEIDRVIIAGMV